MVTNDTDEESFCEEQEELPALATNYKLGLLTAGRVPERPLTSLALEGFREGNFPDICADDVHGQEGSLCAFLAALAPWCQQQ